MLKSILPKNPKNSQKLTKSVSYLKNQLKSQHAHYDPYKLLTHVRTKDYSKRKEGLEKIKNFGYTPFEQVDYILANQHPISLKTTEVEKINTMTRKTIEYLKIDASSLGAISMSMNQGNNGDDKIFVILKSALRSICDWRGVNTGADTNYIEIQNDKWLNYSAKPEDYIAILNMNISQYDEEQEGTLEYEYCPSFMNQKCIILRSKAVETQFMTENMEYFDLWITDVFLARIWQHEFDHLNGIHMASDVHHQNPDNGMFQEFEGEEFQFDETFSTVISQTFFKKF